MMGSIVQMVGQLPGVQEAPGSSPDPVSFFIFGTPPPAMALAILLFVSLIFLGSFYETETTHFFTCGAL